MNGGDIIGAVLKKYGIEFLFTLCGGHISPIIVGSKNAGIRVIDVRDEATAVYAADAVARLSGIPGAAAVTAGPGLTNTITALKNARMAESPLLLLGGAAATILRNRGSLQDIDQLALVKSIAKKAFTIKRNCDIIPIIEHAFLLAGSGTPGPVFVECPIDVLYGEQDVSGMYGVKAGESGRRNLRGRILDVYLKRHVDRIFACDFNTMQPHDFHIKAPASPITEAKGAALKILSSHKPLLLIGSQAMLFPGESARLAEAVKAMGIPVFLAGMARGLLGVSHPLHFHHRRAKALRESDCVILAGMPCDFRLNYGRSFNPHASIISVNRSRKNLYLNIRPDIPVHGDPFLFLCALASSLEARELPWDSWKEWLAQNDGARDAEISEMAAKRSAYINPLRLLQILDRFLGDDALLVADGGDFAASASYIVHPRSPLSWLDPGVFGTLGVGAGFTLGAKLARPRSEVWIIYGDGAAGYSLQEFDSFVRHGIPVIALIGNDAGWTQIARDQIEYLHDDTATRLRRSDYHRVAEAFGGRGITIEKEKDILPAFRRARSLARRGFPVLINALIGTTDFRKGSISM